jgi:hypothetical protein
MPPWKCQHCWAENQAHATQCSYCGKSLEETLKHNLTDAQTQSRKKKIAAVIKVSFLIVMVIGLPIAGYAVWRWHKNLSQAAAADYQDRLNNDQLLDSHGTRAQCEITLILSRRSSSREFCDFVVGVKQYSSSGHTPLGYKMRFQIDAGGVSRIAPGNMVTVIYDSQNPAVNKFEGDRLVDGAIWGPEEYEKLAALLLVLLVVSSSIGVWRARRREQRRAAMISGSRERVS